MPPSTAWTPRRRRAPSVEALGWVLRCFSSRPVGCQCNSRNDTYRGNFSQPSPGVCTWAQAINPCSSLPVQSVRAGKEGEPNGRREGGGREQRTEEGQDEDNPPPRSSPHHLITSPLHYLTTATREKSLLLIQSSSHPCPSLSNRRLVLLISRRAPTFLRTHIQKQSNHPSQSNASGEAAWWGPAMHSLSDVMC